MNKKYYLLIDDTTSNVVGYKIEEGANVKSKGIPSDLTGYSLIEYFQEPPEPFKDTIGYLYKFDGVNSLETPPERNTIMKERAKQKASDISFNLRRGVCSDSTLNTARYYKTNGLRHEDGTARYTQDKIDKVIQISESFANKYREVIEAVEEETDGNECQNIVSQAVWPQKNWSNAEVISITSTTADGTYGADDVINICVVFNEPVTLNGGTLDVTLDTGAVIKVSAESYPALKLSGDYIVSVGHSSGDLDCTAITVNGGTIDDADGNPTTIVLPAITIADKKQIVVSA